MLEEEINQGMEEKVIQPLHQNSPLDINRQEKKGGFGKGFLLGILSSLLICLLICFFYPGILMEKGTDGIQTKLTGDKTEAVTDMDAIESKLEYLQKYVEQYYYYDDEIDMNAVADEVYGAYITGLQDKYSTYYTQEEMNDMMESISGSYCGIGSVVSVNEQAQVVIVLPYEGSPAAEAGLKPGDILLSVDGTSLTNMDLDKAVTLVKGEEGSSAKFMILRGEEEFEVEMTRRQIDIPTVSGEMKDGDIGYVYISGFDLNTTDQFKEIVEDLIKQGAKGFVFDVRDNGGGALDTVVDMLDYMLPEELLVYIEDKYGNRDNYYSDAECISQELPMAVLINGNSASASEVFAGALQDYKRARVFGTKSYGKGVVQNLIPLEDGSGLKLTVALYFTPLGRNFDDNGIDPDVEVKLEVDEDDYDESGYLKEDADTQLTEALNYVKEQIK